VLNASVSCLGRHAAAHPDRLAIIWTGDDLSVSRSITYSELHERLCGVANALARRGDRITIHPHDASDAFRQTR
jgi:acetyl-CoA synthetase